MLKNDSYILCMHVTSCMSFIFVLCVMLSSPVRLKVPPEAHFCSISFYCLTFILIFLCITQSLKTYTCTFNKILMYIQYCTCVGVVNVAQP